MIKYIYIGKDNFTNKGVITIGYRIVGSEIQLAAAFCSKNDQFVKSIGRDIVTGRFSKKKYIAMPMKSADDIRYENVKKYVVDLLSTSRYFGNVLVPSWV